MIEKISNGNTSDEVTSIAQRVTGNPPATQKPVSVAPFASKQPADFVNFNNMLTTELRTNINTKWEACWPINMLKPLVLLDLISYLLFIKKIDESQLSAKLTEKFSDGTPIKVHDELSWKNFKNMDPQSMHKFFTSENGMPELLKSYVQNNLPYSLFIKEPLLLTPTAKLLGNMMDIIKFMEAEDSGTRAAIFEHLLNKSEIAGNNGQVYAPDYVIKLIVALMQPTPEDIIGDPSAGNGSLLVNSAMYIANENFNGARDVNNGFVADIYKGIESDLIQLRIGAMNMILHGIGNPRLEVLNVFSKVNINLREQPTLILSNLFFEGIEDKGVDKADGLETETVRPEIRFLNLILKSLKSGGRTAVIIRDSILYENKEEIKSIRRHIIDDHKLEAVISLPSKFGSLFSGACIVIFTKPVTTTTDKVWFYKMGLTRNHEHKKEADPSNTDKNQLLEFPDEYEDVADILNRWKNQNEEIARTRTDKSFYVPVDEIKANNYNLSFNEYKKIIREPEAATVNKIVVQQKEDIPVNRIEKEATPPDTTLTIPVPVTPVRRRRLPAIIGSLVAIGTAGLVVYFMYFENKNNSGLPPTIRDTVSYSRIKPVQPVNKVTAKTPDSGMLSSERIRAILKDTTGIIHFPEQNNDVSFSTKPPVTKLSKTKNVVPPTNNVVTLENKTPPPVVSANNLKVQYTVADTAYFHDQPDEGTRRKSYLDPVNKNILNPLQDSNGFIYIVYTNRFGRTSKGWINKKDLKPLR